MARKTREMNVKQGTVRITSKQELKLYRMSDRIRRHVQDGTIPFLEAMRLMRDLLREHDLEEEVLETGKKVDLAGERWAFMESFYNDRGFRFSVPLPLVSNREFRRRAKLGQDLFYRPATSEMSNAALMTVVGQANHWTVTHEDRNKIKWETAEQGYWFWTEVADDCPRLGTPWNRLSASIHLLSLEEYVIVWHAYKAQTKKLLDRNTWTWLRIRYQYSETGLGALRAVGYDGSVNVNDDPPDRLAVAYDHEGGRLAEVVELAA